MGLEWPPRGQPEAPHQAPTGTPGIDPDAILDALIWIGLAFIALGIIWNVNGCLGLYESAGRYAGTYNQWCA
jgi:hypothetical protein